MKINKKNKEWEPQISTMFDKIADKYDRLNTFMSLGMDKWWRYLLVKRLKQYWKGGAILDVGCGPGSLAKTIKKNNLSSDVVSMDVSPKMLEIAAYSKNADKVVCASASSLPCPEKSYGAIISAFVLRNLPDLDLFYKEAYRVLQNDGVIVLLDLTRPSIPFIGFLHSLYMKIVLPLGALIFRSDMAAYQYLNQSIKQCYLPEEMVSILEKNGFKKLKVEKLCLGTVTLYTFKKNFNPLPF